MSFEADRDPLRSMGIELREYLIRARKSADDEIRTYPTPIPRCDAQFNFVYEQRLRLSHLLNQVNAALEKEDASAELAGAAAVFVAAHFGESVEERDLRRRIAAHLSTSASSPVADA